MAVLDPLQLIITNFPYDKSIDVEVPNFPNQSQKGYHKVPFSKIVYIERSDFREVEERGYRRFSPNQYVGLKHANYVVFLSNVIKDGNGNISALEVMCKPATEVEKPKAFIHWVSEPAKCEVRIYDRLFKHKNPEDTEVVPGGFISDCNPDSLKIIKNAMVDISVKRAKPFDKFQFERLGYYSIDPDSTHDNLIFNCTVSLKEDSGKM
ncbi:glutamine--tRNA ligase-like [Centruroides sculpturatus]|uniref:glutamine--tRNA ligase-like n=1 Tax=Centruroides sculpturatus TaxID=218467 RepID=UPI000C6D9876|nr:glutamine--tRNA ligase-like [Centruroides sculpturatus]